MANFPGGWLSLQSSSPIPITKYASYAYNYDGAITTEGTVKNVTTFQTPTTAWSASPISLNAEPTVLAVNAAVNVNEAIKAASMNMQTLMANLTNAPIPIKNMIYVYGNQDDNSLLYKMQIALNFGASNYNLYQISVMENAGTLGDEHGHCEVIDFGAGPFTGVNTLNIFFRGYYGNVNIGIRLESSAGGLSSIFELRANVMSTGI